MGCNKHETIQKKKKATEARDIYYLNLSDKVGDTEHAVRRELRRTFIYKLPEETEFKGIYCGDPGFMLNLAGNLDRHAITQQFKFPTTRGK